MRTDTEILKDLIDAVVEHEGDRNTELEFYDRYGMDSAWWTDEQTEEHDEILDAENKSHDRLLALYREATGDNELWF